MLKIFLSLVSNYTKEQEIALNMHYICRLLKTYNNSQNI